MRVVLDKFLACLKSEGVFSAILKTIRYPFREARRKKFYKNISLMGIEDRFTEIYNRKYWGKRDSLSGFGSSYEYTINIREELPRIIDRYSIRTLFDAPCGDFNWMKHVVSESEINYIGADIVKDVVNLCSENYGSESKQFLHLDIIKDELPDADLMVCRDCLFHFSFEDTKKFIRNFVDSGIKYILTTTHINDGDFENRDIETGDYRRIDLFSAPYNFPEDILLRVEDWMPPTPKREMCLWRRAQMIQVLANFR